MTKEFWLTIKNICIYKKKIKLKYKIHKNKIKINFKFIEMPFNP
jgi:hypothetical protein